MQTYGQTIKQYGTEIGPTGGFGKLYIILTGSYTGNLISRLLKVTDFIINKWIPCLFLRIKHFILFKSIISNTYSFMFGISFFFSINGLIETRKQATKAYIAESFKFVVANSWIVLIVQFRGDVSSWIFLSIQTVIWQYYNDLFRRWKLPTNSAKIEPKQNISIPQQLSFKGNISKGLQIAGCYGRVWNLSYM